jgi:hypothetical protein
LALLAIAIDRRVLARFRAPFCHYGEMFMCQQLFPATFQVVKILKFSPDR